MTVITTMEEIKKLIIFFISFGLLFGLLQRQADADLLSWLGLFQLGAPNSAFVSQKASSCSIKPNVPFQKNNCSFSVTAPQKAGTYEFRFFQNGLLIAKSASFIVTPLTPSASLDGPSTIPQGESAEFLANASGQSIEKMVLMRARKDSLLEYDSSWRQVGNLKACNGATTCSISATFSPTVSEIGPWYVIVEAWDKNGTACSGNPAIKGNGPWKSPEGMVWYRCGKNDSKLVEVLGSTGGVKLQISGAPAASYNCAPDPKCSNGKNNLQVCQLICTPK